MASNSSALAYTRRYVAKSTRKTRMPRADTLESSNPGFNRLVKNSRINSQELYHASSIKNSKATSIDTSYSRGLKNGIMTDIKNPNWYYRRRLNEDQNIRVRDDDFGLEGGSSSGAIANIEEQSSGIVSKAIENMGINLSISLSEATVRSADYIVQSNRVHMEAVNNSINLGFDKVMKGFKSLNGNMEILTALAKPLNTHIQTTNYFQTKTLEYQEEIIGLLRQVVSANKQDFSARRDYNPNHKDKNILNDMINPRRLFRKQQYVINAYDKVSNKAYEKLMVGLNNLDPDLVPIVQMFLPELMPFITGSTGVKNFVTGNLGQIINKGRNMKTPKALQKIPFGDTIFDTLRKQIIPKSSYKDKVEVGKHNHGKVDWDGDSRKALLDVIPTQLGQILSAITGDEFRKYDYNSGKFVTASQAKQLRRQNYNNAADAASQSFRDTMGSAINQIQDPKLRDALNKQTESFTRAAFAQDGDALIAKILSEDPKNISDEEIKALGFSGRRTFTMWRKQYDAIHNTKGYRSLSSKNLYGQITIGRDAYGLEMSAREASGDALYSFGQDGAVLDSNSSGSRKNWNKFKAGSNILNQLDEYNHSLMFYIQGIYRHTGYVMKNFELLIPAKGHAAKSGTRRTRAFEIRKGSLPEEANEQNINVESEEELDDNLTPELTDEEAQRTADQSLGFGKEITKENLTKAMNDSFTKILNLVTSKLNSSQRASQVHANMSQNISQGATRESHENTSSDDNEGSESDDGESDRSGGASGIKNTINKGINKYNKGIKFKNKVSEKYNAALAREDVNQFLQALSNKVFGNPDKVPEFMQKQLPETLKGGGIGFVAGAFLGSPILGALVGSSIGFVKNSETAKKFLFGEQGEDGERKDNGLISKKTQEFFKQHAPSMGKGAGVGAAAGLFLGSPVLGAVMGATAGYISSSDKAKKFLFGESDGEEYKEGLIPKKIQDQIKKAAPKMGIGAIVGGLTLGGPLGLAGSMILGSALGFASESEGFKKWMFGESGTFSETPFFKKLQENLFDPIKEAFFNVGEIAKQLLINTSNNIKKSITEFLFKRVGGKIKSGLAKSAIGRGIAKVGRGIGNAALGVASAPGKALRYTTRRIGLKNNYTLRDKNGRILSLEDREALRDKMGYRSSDLDTFLLGNSGNVEDIDTLSSIIQNSIDPGAQVRNNLMQQQIGMGRSFRNIKDQYNTTTDSDKRKRVSKVLDTIFKSVKGGRLNLGNKTPEEYVRSIEQRYARRGETVVLSDQERQSVIQQLSNYSSENDTRRSLIDSANSDFEAALRNAGLQDKQISRLMNMSAADKRYALEQLNIEKGRLTASTTSKDEKPVEAKTVEQATTQTIPGWLERISNSLETFRENIIEGRKTNDNKSTNSTVLKASNAIDNVTNSNSTDITPGATRTGPNGLKQVWDGDQWKDDVSDSENIKKIEEEDKKKKSLFTIPIIGTTLTGIHGLLSKLNKKLFGEKEDGKKGIFGQLFDKLLGEDGLLGGVLGFFTGSKGAGVVGKLLSKFTLANALPMIASGLGLGAILKAIHGDFDEAAEKIGEAEVFRGNDSKSAFSDQRSSFTDKNGNIGFSGSDNRLSTLLKRNTLSGLATGRGSLLSFATGKFVKTVSGKNITGSGIRAALKGATAAGINNSGLINGIRMSLKTLLSKFPSILPRIPFLNLTVEQADEIGSALFTHIDEALTNMSGKLATIANGLSKALAVLQIAVVIGSGINAWGNAETILGITERATTGQRLIAVLIAVTNSLIPIIGNLIPNKTLVNIFIDICTKLGLDQQFEGLRGLKEQRERAEQEVKEYNELTGENLSIQEYNERGIEKNESGEFVFGKARAGILTRAKNSIKSGFYSIKEQGFKTWAGNKLSGVKQGISAFGANLSEGFNSLISKTTNTIADIKQAGSKILEYVVKGDPKGLMSSTFEGTEEDPTTPFFQSVYNAGKILGVLPASIAYAGGKVGRAFKKIFDIVKSARDKFNSKTDETLNMIESSESISDFLGKFTNVEIPGAEGKSEGYIAGFKTAVIASRLSTLPVALSKFVGKKIGEAFNALFTKVKTGITSYIDMEGQLVNLARSGDINALINSQYSDDEGNPVGGFLGGLYNVEKFFDVPVAGIYWLGHKIKDIFNSIKEKSSSGFSNYRSILDNHITYVQNGDVAGLLASETTTDAEGDPFTGFWKAFDTVQKILVVPAASMNWVGKKISNKWQELTGNISDKATSLGTSFNTMSEKASTGDIKGIWDTNLEMQSGKTGILDHLFNVINSIGKVIFTIVGGINKLAEPFKEIGNWVEEKVGWVKDKADAIGEGIGKAASGAKNAIIDGKNYLVDSAGRAYDATTGFFCGLYDASLGQLINGGSGSGIRRIGYSAGTSGIINQTNSAYSGLSVGGRSMADNGCGPSSALMAINDLGSRSSMQDAISVANKYQTAGGTDAAYFGEMFARNGAQANYYRNKGDIAGSIASGQPTVLMGQDSSNRSKANSPFGPNNHYVVANGFDRSGNVIIKDPESSGIKKYNSKILNNVKIGIGASGWRTGFAGGSMAYASANAANKKNIVINNSDTKKVIWDFLISHGLKAHAAAGVMGCWQAEAGNNPNRIEGDYLSSYPGFEAVSSSQAAMDQYTTNVLFPIYARDGIKINQGAYLGNDGHYYPGFGLAQWTGPRCANLFAWAKNKGMDWRSLKAQLDFFMNGPGEFGSRNLIGSMNNAPSIDEATKIFYNKYEGCTRNDWLQTRISYAKQIYNTYSGSTVSTDFNSLDGGSAIASGESSISTGNSSSSSSNGGGILSKIIGAFTTGFSALLGGTSSNSSSIDGSYNSSNGYSTSDNWTGTPSNLGSGSDPVDYMNSVLGQLQYSMSGPRNPEAGSADCSSTVRWAIKKATGGAVDIGGYTGAQQSDPNSYDVFNLHGATANGTPNGLKRNDILFFTRDYARKSPSTYPYGVGHVGLYMGNGKYIDHGSGMGPKIKDMPGTGLTQVRRLKDWTWDKSDIKKRQMSNNGVSGFTQSASGSGLIYNSSSAGQSLLNDTSRSYSGEFKGINKQTVQNAANHLIGVTGGALSSTGMQTGKMSRDTAAVLSTLITLIQQLVKNTDDISGIYEQVQNIASGVTLSGGNSGTNAKRSSNTGSHNYSSKLSQEEINLTLGKLKAECDQILAS